MRRADASAIVPVVLLVALAGLVPGRAPATTVHCEPQSPATGDVHPPRYFHLVTPAPGESVTSFRVETDDVSNQGTSASYSLFQQPGTWPAGVVQGGFVTWTCTPGIHSPCPLTSSSCPPAGCRFGFDNAHPSRFGCWTTNTDSAANHAGQPDGLGFRVHVPAKFGGPFTPSTCAAPGQAGGGGGAVGVPGGGHFPIPSAPRIAKVDVYSAKFLCGEFDKTPGPVAGPEIRGEGPVKPGNYQTAINVHNPNRIPVLIHKKAVLLFSGSEPLASPAPGDFEVPHPPGMPVTAILPPDWGLEIDCADIRQVLLGAPPAPGAPLPFIKGWVILEVVHVPVDVPVSFEIDTRDLPLDVVAAYTAQGFDLAGPQPAIEGFSVDVERVLPTTILDLDLAGFPPFVPPGP
jgi:hypothetical protein